MKGRDTGLLVLLLLIACAGFYIMAGGGSWSVFRESPPEPGAGAAGEAATGTGDLPGLPEEGGEEGPGGEHRETGDAGPASADEEHFEEGEYDFLNETTYHVDVSVRDAEDRPLECKVRILDPTVDWVLGDLVRVGVGEFRGYLPRGGRWAAEADHEGTRMRAEFELAEPLDRERVTIRYPGSGSVSGTVYSSRGALREDTKGDVPIIGASDLSVELIPDVGAKGLPKVLLSSAVAEGGSYRIGAVPAGKYLLRIKNKFYAAELAVGDNEHVVHDVRLGGGRIHGRVTEEGTGRPVTECQVVLAMTSVGKGVMERAGLAAASDRFSPDENGRYEFANLPPGEYRLFANSMTHAPRGGAATIGEGERDRVVDFVLKPGSAVDISITDLAGAPLDGAMWITQGIRCGFTGHVGGLPAGTSDFIAFAPGHEVRIREAVEFKPGEATKLAFELAPAPAATLVFRDPRGNAVEGVRVSLPRKSHDLQALMAFFLRERRLAFRITGADGRVAVRGVRPGPARVVAKRSGFALFDTRVEIREGEVPVVLEPAETTFRFRVRITAVNDGSTAAGLGLGPGDVIVSYDGKAIDTAAALSRAVAAAKERGTASVELVVETAGAERKLSVAPGALGVRVEEYEEE